MYSQVTLDPAFEEAFEAFEREHDVRLRVLNGNAERDFNVVPDDDYDLTVVSWGGRNNPPAGPLEIQWPGGLFGTGLPGARYLHGRMEPDEAYEVEGFKLALIEPFVVYYTVPLDSQFGLWPGGINVENVVTAPFRAAMDPNYAETYAAQRLERELETFRRYHAEAPERRLAETRTSVSRFENYLREYQSNVTSTLNSLREERIKAEIVEAQVAEGVDADKTAEEWSRLKEHPRARDITFQGNELVIVTDHITLSHPRDEYMTALMGSFKIKLNLEANSVVFENLDSPRNGRPHPHIDEAGYPCYGELGATVTRLLQEAQYIGLFELLLEFLESYNPEDDWGRNARRWTEMPFVPTDDREAVTA